MAENFQNFYVTKLREACDASATTIYVDNPPNFSEGTLVIEFSNSTKHEIIHFTGKSGYGLTGCTRGHEGTTAQSHSAGVDVRQNVTAGILDKIINRAITTENIADNAVTTAKINDGAVTANKIDFTTFKTNFPVESINLTIHSSMDISVTLYRVGNVVFAQSNGSLVKNFQQRYAEVETGATVPLGFRPILGGMITSNCRDANGVDAKVNYYSDSSGKITVSTSSIGNGRFTLFGCWITNDEWPTN